MAQTKIKSGLLEDNISIVGNLTVDTNTLYVDSANNRVGIGTTSPDSNLEINGTGWTKAGHKISSYYSTNAGDGEILNLGVTGNIGYIQSLNGTTPNALTLDGSSVTFRTGTYSTAMTIDSSGNVGIGVSSGLTQKLNINGSIRLANNTGINVFDSGGTERNLIFFDSSNNLRFWSGQSNDERMRIDSSGNVGIGTTSSATKLHISTPQSGAASGTGITISGWNGTGESRVQLMSFGIGDGTFAIRTGTSNTERMRIDSSGRVGINDTAPSFPLTIYGGSGAASYDIFRAYAWNGTSNKRVEIKIDNTEADSIAIWNTSKSGGASVGHSFQIDGSERLRIDSSGNVLIGRTTLTGASGKFEVEQKDTSTGGIIINTSDATKLPRLHFRDGVGAADVDGVISASDGLRFYTSNTSERMRITTSGNVGIGTTSPSAKLDVVGTIECTSLTETSALRFKENIQEDVDSSIIDKLRPVSYDWKETGDKDYGFIAEEVDELDSILTTKEEDGQLIGIKYTKLIPFLVKKIQEQEERIKQLENGKS